jgi:hypothetical protein
MRKQQNQQNTKEADQEIDVPYSFKKKIIQIFIFSAILFFLNIGAKNPLISSGVTEKNVINIIDQYEVDMNAYPSLVRERLHSELVKEVDKYMDYVAPNNKIIPELFVTKCQEYNMDITFVLAQAVLESHLGTKGKAITTNSVFNVGALDDGRVLNSYKNPNESIEPFLELIQNEYLGDKKQITDLLKDGGYKNLSGKRYATSRIYESQLRTTIVHINMRSSISMYQNVMLLPDEKILAFFGPLKEENDSTQYTALK